MTDRIGVTKGGPATSFWLECDRVGQSVAGNYTTLRFRLRAANGPGGSTGSYYGGSGFQAGSVDGYYEFGRHSGQPFLPSGVPNGGVRWNDGHWDMNIGHNADGTWGGVTLRMHLQYGSINEAHTAWFNDFPTIPRASQSTFTSPDMHSLIAGQPVAIATNRAASSFTHDIDYYFGNASGRALTNVGTGGSWTVPLALMNQLPNATTGTGLIRTYTYNGGSFVGTKDSAMRINVPASIVPTWTSVSASEAETAVATAVGAYVQGVSRLNYQIVGAAGVYGSTISLQRLLVAGQVVNGASGSTAPINASGVVPVTWFIQDSRGRQKTQTTNINVLPYSTPVIPELSVERALSDGTVDPDDGTFLRVKMSASVQSLLNGTQRNFMQIRVYTRLMGESSWGTPKQTLNPSGILFNNISGGQSIVVAGPFDVDKSYQVRVEVTDRYNTTASQSTVSVAAVFMHWSEDGLGLGKYHENGMLDVAGPIFAGAKLPITSSFVSLPTMSGPTHALLDPFYRGPGPARVSFLPGTDLSTEAYEWLTPYVPWGNRVVEMVQQGESWAILGQSAHSQFGGPVDCPLGPFMYPYNEFTGTHTFRGEGVTATRYPSGIVALTGVIRNATNVSGSIVATLPEGFRPDADTIFPIENGDNRKAITVNAAGTITLRSGHLANSYISLDGIAYPAAGVATWTDIGTAGTAWQNGWGPHPSSVAGQHGTPAFWKDEYGMVWFRGTLAPGTVADNTRMFTLPSDHLSFYKETHIPAASADGYGLVGAHSAAQATAGLVVKANTSTTGYLSLGGVTIITEEARQKIDWYSSVIGGGWSYSAADAERFPPLETARRGDGLAVAQGFVRGGTVGDILAGIRDNTAVHRRAIIATAANAARSRTDVTGRIHEDEGAATRLRSISGANAWWSLDGMKWVTS